MNKKNRNIASRLMFGMLLILPALAIAQTAEEPLPLDNAVRTGKLPNGFTYFIRKNTTPEKRVELYLANKTGSILETDGQQGLAHFMEHMSFNGTRHFPKNQLIDYLQKSGVRFGSDLNASTGFDQTLYQLPLPSDNPEILHNGLQILRDWAQDATLDQVEIDKERGVVLEEKRLRLGVQQRVQDQVFPLLVNYSQYARRMPIGTEEVLKNFKRDTLLTFYKDWYRPDMQALIVVGDIDVAAMEKTIKTLFGDLTTPRQVKPRREVSIPLTGKTQFIAVTDKELSRASIELYVKGRKRPLKTRADYRQMVITSLFNQLMSGKLREKTQTQQLPYLNAGISIGGLIGDLDALTVHVDVKNNDYEQGMKSVMQTFEAARRNGFTQPDIDRATQNYLGYLQSLVQEKDKRNSAEYVREYVNYFLEGEASPGIETEYALTKDILSSLGPDDFKKLAAQYWSLPDRDIIITAPETDKDKLPDQARIASWLLAVQQGDVAQETDDFSGRPLLTTTLPAGKVVSRKEDKKMGTTELTLSNGVKVTLKPTTFKNDEIQFSAISPGGTSLYPDDQFETASSAASLVASSGVGEFSPVALQKVLAGKQAGVSPFIGERAEGMSGSATAKDLETAMQLVYLYFTKPRTDAVVFNNIIERSKNSLINRYANPSTVFSDTVMQVLGNHSIRRTPPSVEKLEKLDLDLALKIYKQRFADAGDFHFFFVGSLTEATLMPLLEKYIASLPASKSVEQAKDLGITIPGGKIKKVVQGGKEDQAAVRLVLSGNYTYNDENNMHLEALKAILGYKLVERLREVEGNTYSPNVRLNYTKVPHATYSFTIAFGCSPANVDKLIAATQEEILAIKTSALMADYLQKFASEQKGVLGRQVQENGYWLNYLVDRHVNGEKLLSLPEHQKMITGVTASGVQKAARTYFNDQNFIQFILLPEAGKL